MSGEPIDIQARWDSLAGFDDEVDEGPQPCEIEGCAKMMQFEVSGRAGPDRGMAWVCSEHLAPWILERDTGWADDFKVTVTDGSV